MAGRWTLTVQKGGFEVHSSQLFPMSNPHEQLGRYLLACRNALTRGEISKPDHDSKIASAVMAFNRENKNANNRLLIFLNSPDMVCLASALMQGMTVLQLRYEYQHIVSNCLVTEVEYFNLTRLDYVVPI